MNSIDLYKNVNNQDEIDSILKEYEIEIENETDVEFFNELIYGIVEDYPMVRNLETVLERILIYLVNKQSKNIN